MRSAYALSITGVDRRVDRWVGGTVEVETSWNK